MKIYPTIAGVYGITGVAMGAFGAHALEAYLHNTGHIEIWRTAVEYQMWHALTILTVSASKVQGRYSQISLGCFALGISVFSGSLYILALGGPRWLGPITPIGGTLLIAGWGFLIASLTKKSHSESD